MAKNQEVVLPESKDELIEKWNPVIEGTGKWESVVGDAPKVRNPELLATQLEILEQTELKEVSGTSAVSNYIPVLIPMVRRVMPALIGPNLFGTQPMNSPSGMIFALKSLYTNDSVNPIAHDAGAILVLADASGYSDGDSITGDTSGATGTIRHIEDNTVLVDVASGTFEVEDVNTATTSISAVWDAEALQNIIFSNYSGTYATTAGEYMSTDMKEMGFEIISSTVNAQTRKLKAKWTVELEDDLRAVHGLNAEQLLTSFSSDEMIREMNTEFLRNVKSNSGETNTWTFSGTSDVQGRYENEKYQALANEINRQKIYVAKTSMRGQATWMAVSTGVLTALRALGMQPNTDPYDNTYMGTYNGMEVYADIFNEEAQDYIYFGYKGPTEVDAGLFYCPYVPLKINKGYGDEDNIPRLFFSTRYGLTANPFGASNYYRKLVVSGLPAAG